MTDHPSFAIVLNSPQSRNKAQEAVRRAPDGYRLTIEYPKHSDSQRELLWELLGQLSRKATYHGMKLSKEDWKIIFLSGVRKEIRVVPNLDGDGFVHLDRSIRPLSKKEMQFMIELIEMWAHQNGVTLVRTMPGLEDGP